MSWHFLKVFLLLWMIARLNDLLSPKMIISMCSKILPTACKWNPIQRLRIFFKINVGYFWAVLCVVLLMILVSYLFLRLAITSKETWFDGFRAFHSILNYIFPLLHLLLSFWIRVFLIIGKMRNQWILDILIKVNNAILDFKFRSWLMIITFS